MAIILNIETSTKNCSVSIAENGNILAIKELNEGKFSHAEKLHPFVEEVLQEAEVEIEKLDAIAVSKGPGSYTGLRIGVSAAKGLCYALERPLIALSTLKVLATAISVAKDEFIIPLLDARRMEVYCAVFDDNYHQLQDTQAKIIDENSFSEFLDKGKVHFLGDGAAKCQEVIKHKNAVFVEDHFPSAREMGKLSFEKYQNDEFVDLAYFEPFYLKDFIAGIPKKLF
ncbi:MAG: tRNA (adenosine(37)-N6)-threonylcarbamoyltransferase complex dimerization subunit type 1 TsaB [Bacteroidota bacterium]